MAIDRIRVNEGSSKTISFILKDSSGAVVPLASLGTAELTLYDLQTYVPSGSPVVGILNDRNAQDVKNANNVTVHATTGLVTWAMQSEDNVIVTSRRQVERHRARFRFVVSGVELDYPIEIEVVNMREAA